VLGRLDELTRKTADHWQDQGRSPPTKDNFAALEALGFILPSTAYLIGVVIFGIVGYVAYRYGKKMSLPATKWIGIALMLYPYAIPATWLLYVVGPGLCVGVYLSARS
jgi:hypothetical protein